MWTATLDYSPQRVLFMKLLSRFWPGACFTSLSPLRVQNLPRSPLPANNWVRVRNRLAGIGGNDLHLLRGKDDARIAAAALGERYQGYAGHEVVGEVIEIGENVQHLRVGDRVILQNKPNCVSAGMQKLCRSCAATEYNLCERALLPGSRPIGGGWSEEMLLHEQLLFHIVEGLSDEQAVMLEPTAVALHALLRRPPRSGEQVLIIGAGTIGLLTLQLVRALVPQARVSVLARHSFQVEQATRMGAAHIIYPNDSYAGVQNATGALRYQGMLGNRILMGGYDVIYDTVGSNKTLHHALRWVRAQGTVVLVGIDPAFMHIDLSPLWLQQINLIGSHSHGMDHWPIGTQGQQTTFSIVQQLLKDGWIHPEQLITQRFALNNYQEALLAAMDKSRSRAIKVVFDYSLLPASVVPNVRASARRPRPAVVSSTTIPRRFVAPDTAQNRPDSSVTQPEPVHDEIRDEETAHSLPVIPRSAMVDSQVAANVAPPPPGYGIQSNRPPDVTVVHEAPVEEPYIAGEDEATIVVRTADVQTAYKAMEALQIEPEPQRLEEPLATSLPSMGDRLPQEDGVPILEMQEQTEVGEVEGKENRLANVESKEVIGVAAVEEQPVEAETGDAADPSGVEERRAEAQEREEGEEKPPESAETEASTAAEQQVESGVLESEEEQVKAEDVAEISVYANTEQSSEGQSQAQQQVDKTVVGRPQSRQRSNRRSKPKR